MIKFQKSYHKRLYLELQMKQFRDKDAKKIPANK